MKFTYKALHDGTPQTGEIEANTEREVVEYLRNNDFFPLHIKKRSTFTINPFAGFSSHASADDILTYFRQMGIMLNAGLTITGAHDILIEQTQKAGMRLMLEKVNSLIRGGQTYSSSLEQFPSLFPQLYISLIKAGEISGKLNTILVRMADDMETQRAFKAKFKSAMTYPALILVGVVGVIFVLVTFVVPQLLGLYTELNIELPFATQILINASNFSAQWWPLMLAGTGLVAYTLRRFFHTDKGQMVYYSTLMSIPIIGPLAKVGGLVTATRTLALLLSSSVMVLESIEIVQQATTNIIFQHSFKNLYTNIQKGLTISQGLEKEQIFPPVLVQMTSVGEKTGKLDEILAKISDYFESEANMAMRTLTTAIEPIILVVMGGIVLFIVTAVLSPIYNLTSQIGNQ
jgi:type II secretory pathway component PulF